MIAVILINFFIGFPLIYDMNICDRTLVSRLRKKNFSGFTFIVRYAAYIHTQVICLKA